MFNTRNPKKVIAVNSVNFASTGSIMLDISKVAQKEGYASYVAYANSRSNNRKRIDNSILIGSIVERNLHLQLAYYTGLNGCFSILGTRKFIKEIHNIQPDIIHLHNLHNCYINIPMLFSYIKRNNIRVVWTLHDCWSFTGHCPYYSLIKCEKWKTGCYDCPQHLDYPKSYLDLSKKMHQLKKKWFTGVENMTIVTPSEWLAGEVKKSFLKDYQIKVINNGIDLSVFKPTLSTFREDNGITDKYVVLGVASVWEKRKGIDVFVDLSKKFNIDKYKIVLVGTDDEIDKQLPDNIISIHRTQNQSELAEIYSVADVFVNPTREENFPTVNMEALACGTPVITFQTGGSPEMLDGTCGYVVPCDDNAAILNGIISTCELKPFTEKACLERARNYDMNDKFSEYINLYNCSI